MSLMIEPIHHPTRNYNNHWPKNNNNNNNNNKHLTAYRPVQPSAERKPIPDFNEARDDGVTVALTGLYSNKAIIDSRLYLVQHSDELNQTLQLSDVQLVPPPGELF